MRKYQVNGFNKCLLIAWAVETIVLMTKTIANYLELENAREHAGRPVGAADKDHDLGEREAGLLEDPLDGLDSDRVDADEALDRQTAAHPLAEALLLHRDRVELQQRAYAGGDDADVVRVIQSPL